jgi:transcriptional regulator with PAS, ATPase and Fis domain
MATLESTSALLHDRNSPVLRVARQLPNELTGPHCESTEEDPFFDAFPPEMIVLREQVKRVVPQETTLLLTGETGTGKTRLARLMHELSPRRNEPFLVVDCGAISPNLIESEIFGHVKGAFTGADRDRAGKLAAVGRGTLLLDEINSLPLPLQSKLLRAVDERVFEPVGSERSQPLRARLIAATNAPLDDEVAAGRFRADLYFRINVVGFYLPPLRDRRASIAPLAQKFLTEMAARNRPDVGDMTPEVVRALQGYDWPGNIRELRNVIERAVALCPGPNVQLLDLPEAVRLASVDEEVGELRESLAIATLPQSLANLTLAQSKEAAEIVRIKEALTKHSNNRLRAASELGISRMGLYKKLHKYGLTEC